MTDRIGPVAVLVQPKLPRVNFYPGAVGEPYRPCNGSEGEYFWSMWCEECQRDKVMSGQATVEDADKDPDLYCEILNRSFRDDEPLPEWTYGADGQPCCTQFVALGQPEPTPRCAHTADLFEEGQEPKPTGERRMSTDRELLEAAAKAAGMDDARFCDMAGWGEVRYGLSEAIWSEKHGEYWNPLTDDGDALRLAVKLAMSVEISEHEASTYAYAGKVPRVYAMEMWRTDRDAATRRAIVRAAASLSQEGADGMPTGAQP